MSQRQGVPSALPQIVRYWDQRSQGYALQVDAESKNNLQDAYLPWFESIQTNGAVLDVGCGPGFFSTLLARAGYRVTALDASSEMLEKARQRAESAGVCVDFIQGDAQNLPFAGDSFDCVCSRNLVWNLEFPQSAYREWLRVLKPGGILVIFDGNHYRYLFDERYARVHCPWVESGTHQMLGVDARVIDGIAADLPLSREARPAWDEKTLSDLGASVQSTVLRTLTDPATGEVLAADFVLLAEKSSASSASSNACRQA